MGEWNGLQKSPVLSDTICVSPWENTGRGSVVLHLPCDSEPSPVGLQPKMGALQKWGIWSAQVISFLLTTVQCSMQFLCLTCCPPRVLFAKKTPNKHTHTPRTVSRRWKQLGATRPGPLNSQGQRLAHPVLSWHIGLTFVVLHNWLGYATRLALKKNVYVLNISYLVSLSNLLFAVFFFFFFVQIKSCGTFIIFPARLGAKFDELWDNLFENTVCGPGQVKHYGSYVIWHLQGPLSSHATAGAKYLSSTCKNIVLQ